MHGRGKGTQYRSWNREIQATEPVTTQENPVDVWTGPEGSRKLRFPDFMTVGT
jgi:hypothetical protein